MHRIRVLTLIDHVDARGGAERLALQIASRLDPSVFESTLCASRTDTGASDPAVADAIAELDAAGVRFFTLGRRGKLDVWVWARLWRHLRRERIDVLHAHKFGSNVWGTLVGRLARVPVVVCHEHSWSYVGRPARRLLDRHLIARFSTALIAVSQEDRRQMMEVERIPAADIELVPNGAWIPEPATIADVRGELGIDPAAPVVGSVGYLRPVKAFDVLLRATARLRERHPAVVVLIAGDGEERAALEALIDELGVGENVRLLGRRRDVHDVIAAFDVAVCCSDHEGSPVSVMECMDAAKPMVVTAVGGLPDMVTDGVEGLLVAPRDADALAGALDRLLADPELAAQMGAAARRRRRVEFDLSVTVQRLAALYRRHLPPASAPRP